MAAYSRSQCREWALKFLYQADFAGGRGTEDLEIFWSHFHPEGPGVPAYLRELAMGEAAHQEELDALIARYSEHWRLERMTVVDRNLLRLAAFELIYLSKIPSKVVINEAVELAKRYGSEDSSAFVNGILDQIRAARESQG
ncbi:MAG: transcription antitermination factor NusB [Deltaproteobacteria bacterium]|nr:transcription antitermination factor NusB [Deltaproteobacteria bacterium]